MYKKIVLNKCIVVDRCIGFEWMAMILGGDGVVGPGFDSIDFPQKLGFTARSPGRMFASFNATMLHWLATQNITYVDHGTLHEMKPLN